MDGAVIGANSVVAAGTVVPPGKKFPAKSMIMGNPAIIKRALTEEEIEIYSNHFTTYVKNKNDFLNSEIVKLLK
jgi:carbonic anhydrase/acetyltransferase-like protein (isoleucine patch superfamily)